MRATYNNAEALLAAPLSTEEKLASDVVDEFLEIVEPYFQPDQRWKKLEDLANEFLYEGIKRALHDYHKQLKNNND